MNVIESRPGRSTPEELNVANQVLGGRYRLLRHIGSGGMGSVYEAEHVLLGRRFALKLLRGDLRGGRTSEQRLQREARVLARLEHENIVSVFEIGHDDARGHYVVLEYVRGRTLRQELAEHGVRPLLRVMDIAEQVARALAHAHAAGVVHRDLKPDNIMLSAHADGTLLVKLLDFGVARVLDDTKQESLTATGDGVGTAAYMAPEQARGEATLNARTDVFALGVTLYESLAGLRPYRGDSYNETLFLILNRAHEPLAALRPDLPLAVSHVLERALAKNAAERFASIDELLSSLRDAADLHGAGPAFAASLDAATQGSLATSTNSSLPRARSPGSLRSVALGAVLGAGLSLLLLQHRSPRATADTPPLARVSPPAPRAAPSVALLPTSSARSEAAGPETRNLAQAPASSRRAQAPASSRRIISTAESSRQPEDPLQVRGYQLDSPYD